ncbi:TrkA C-terminal domain-containing protein [Lyngbya sp. CCY1209]|uniref:TrkA C-terminal domain-containing protein n=1 Tax=Lyngbya sp. CCY1209 TaxID=2886103 RepID=UPI002D1FCE3F|nr:TrkA C-terminal domain-containing protein [Lyngbya sp. CCY1209]MEB3885185.1 TrkA C-terminal domain-containing protein [Lyngbya sp. CCY1209]
MAALISLFVAVSLSLFITRLATEALVMTGLSRQSATFQARSAFTGAGFTTDESEKVVNHPVRRRIVLWLMFLGNVGLVTMVSSVVLTFLSSSGDTDGWLVRILALAGGMVLLWGITNNRIFNRHLNRLVRWTLRRWTRLDVRDYASLLRLQGSYRVLELQVRPEDWLANRNLQELNLRAEGVMVLGIIRADKTYVGAPNGTTCIYPDDLLILYGRQPALAELDSRRADYRGEKAHQEAIAINRRIQEEQQKQDLKPQ